MAQPPRREMRKLLVKSLRGRPQDIENFRRAAKADLQNAPLNTHARATAAEPELRWWDRDPVVRAVAAEGVRQAMVPIGAARGLLHSAEGVAGAAVFAGRLIDPDLDKRLSPGMTAADEFGNAVRSATDYVRTSTPRKVASDVGKQLSHFRADIDPAATPQAPTLLGEIIRNGKIGLNQGEVGFDVASTLYGGEAFEGLAALSGLSKAATPAKYLAHGYAPKLAEYLASPNPETSMGHHFLTRKMVKDTPAALRPVVRAISESRYSVLKPKGMSRGDFYKLHFEVDPSYWGGKVSKEFGGGGWSGKKLGWQKHGLLGQIVYGSPAPLKAAVISPPVIAAGIVVNRPKSNRGIR